MGDVGDHSDWVHSQVLQGLGMSLCCDDFCFLCREGRERTTLWSDTSDTVDGNCL